MDVFHGKFSSAISVFPDLHKNDITNNNWEGSSMGGTSSGQIIKNKEGLICTTMVFYHSKLQLKNM